MDLLVISGGFDKHWRMTPSCWFIIRKQSYTTAITRKYLETMQALQRKTHWNSDTVTETPRKWLAPCAPSCSSPCSAIQHVLLQPTLRNTSSSLNSGLDTQKTEEKELGVTYFKATLSDSLKYGILHSSCVWKLWHASTQQDTTKASDFRDALKFQISWLLVLQRRNPACCGILV